MVSPNRYNAAEKRNVFTLARAPADGKNYLANLNRENNLLSITRPVADHQALGVF
jgi:hypothetical protein